jgi:hypothetical protein
MLSPAVKKFFRILFDTAWGAAATSVLLLLVSNCLMLAGCLVQNYFDEERLGIAMAVLTGPLVCLFLLSILAGIASFFRNLWRKEWKRSFFQFLCGAAALFLFLYTGVVFSLGLYPLVARHAPGGERLWIATGADVPFPFAVECRERNRIPGEACKRIAFASGKRVRFGLGHGECGPTAVYALSSGAFALVEEHAWRERTCAYRVDPVAESVEVFCAGTWFALPDDCIAIDSSLDAEVLEIMARSGKSRHFAGEGGRPDGGDFGERRYLGLVRPDGTFDSDAADPFPDFPPDPES